MMGWLGDAAKVVGSYVVNPMLGQAVAAYEGGKYLGNEISKSSRSGPGGYKEAARGQSQLSQMLMEQAQGRGGPSVAEQYGRAVQDNALAQSIALAKSYRGNPGAAYQAAQQSQTQMAPQFAAQLAALRAQEQLSAQQQLGALLAQMRGLAINQSQQEQAVPMAALSAASQGGAMAARGMG